MTDAPKHSGGRPPKYREVYCNEVIETMATGLSLTAFAGEIGVSRGTINNWRANYPEFAEAVLIGTAKRVRYLERTMLDGECGPRVTARIFALKNADPEEWRDKHHYEHTGKDGGAIVTENRVSLVTALGARLREKTGEAPE